MNVRPRAKRNAGVSPAVGGRLARRLQERGSRCTAAQYKNVIVHPALGTCWMRDRARRALTAGETPAFRLVIRRRSRRLRSERPLSQRERRQAAALQIASRF